MAMVDRHASVERRHELDDLAGMQGTVDGVERAALRGPMLDDRVGDLAQRLADGADPGEIALGRARIGVRLHTQAIGALAVDHATVDEPAERVPERGQALDLGTIFEVVGVQEIEGVFESNLMGVMPTHVRPANGGLHFDNHYIALDRLRARGYCSTSNR